MLDEMNKEAIFKVSTPVGMTDEVKVREIVKQGTVYGPKLCCASTGKVNEGIMMEEVIYPNISIRALAYVDDVNSSGCKQVVEGVMKKCGEMEKEKMWEFSTEKSNWMCQKNRKRNVEEIDVEVAQGKIPKVRVYRFLGNMVNEEGNMDDQLKFMETKLVIVVREGRKMCCQSKIGKFEVAAKKLVYQQLAVASVFFNIEVWTNFRKSDMQKMESIQGQLLKGLYGLPKSTPYWGLLYELDVIPIKYVITYKRLMLYHNIMNSDDKRVIKHIVREQEASEYEKCWFGNLKREGENCGIIVNEDLVRGKRKSKWKKEVKKKIEMAVKKEMEEKKKCSKKMRFLGRSGSDTYLNEVYNEDARLAMKIRLNMVDWIGGNYGKDEGCPVCGGEDTTEHVFSCGKMAESVTLKNLEEGKAMADIVHHFRETEKTRKDILMTRVQINMNSMYTAG